MERRQLEWQWRRPRRTEPPAPRPERPARRPEPRPRRPELAALERVLLERELLERALALHPRGAREAEPRPRPRLRGGREAEPRPRPRLRAKPERESGPPPRGSPQTLKEGLGDLERFIREVGGGRIGPVRASGENVTVGLRAADGELYHLRIVTRAYPTRPPSCTFVDSGGKPTSGAWPAYDPSGPFRPPNFICTPPTAEFFRYHSDRKYHPSDGTLVNTVCTIFTALNSAGYSGRYPGRHRSPRERARRAQLRMRGE